MHRCPEHSARLEAGSAVGRVQPFTLLFSPLPNLFHRRPSSLDLGLISQVTRSITGACVQSPSLNKRTRRDRRVESSALEALRSRCESCRRDHLQTNKNAGRAASTRVSYAR